MVAAKGALSICVRWLGDYEVMLLTHRLSVFSCVAIGAVLGTLGCEQIAEMHSLQRDVQNAFAVDRVELTRTNAELEVKLVNSAHPLSSESRKTRAQQVAEFVRDHYSSYWSLDEVRVEFAQETRAGLVKRSKSVSFVFPTSDLGPGRTTPADSSPAP